MNFYVVLLLAVDLRPDIAVPGLGVKHQVTYLLSDQEERCRGPL